MWSLIVILRTELDPSVNIQSPVKLPLSNYPIWSPASLSLDGFSTELTNSLIFDFKLVHPRGSILVKSIHVPVGRLSWDATNGITRIIDFTADNVSISYNAHKYTEDDHQLGQIQISVISIKYDMDALLAPADGDRIALQCGSYQVERCQQWSESLLRWTSGPSHRSPICPIHMIGEPIDGPDYSNEHHMLPKYVAKEQQFALLNYKFTPPTIVPFLVRFNVVPTVPIDGIDGIRCIGRLRERCLRRFQMYNVTKVIEQAERSILVKFFYTIVKSRIQIQLIEVKMTESF